MKTILLALIATAIQTTLSKPIFTARARYKGAGYKGGRLIDPPVEGGSSIRADRSLSDSFVGQNYVELTSTLSLSFPNTAVGAKSTKNADNTGLGSASPLSLSFPDASTISAKSAKNADNTGLGSAMPLSLSFPDASTIGAKSAKNAGNTGLGSATPPLSLSFPDASTIGAKSAKSATVADAKSSKKLKVDGGKSAKKLKVAGAKSAKSMSNTLSTSAANKEGENGMSIWSPVMVITMSAAVVAALIAAVAVAALVRKHR
jgi:hypothetical protein